MEYIKDLVLVKVKYYSRKIDSFGFNPPTEKSKIYTFLCEADLANELEHWKTFAIITKNRNIYSSPVKFIGTQLIPRGFMIKTFQEIVDFIGIKEGAYVEQVLDFNCMMDYNNALVTRNSPKLEETYSNIFTSADLKNDKKESKEMNKSITNILEFGKVATGDIKISLNGLAFKDKTGAYVTYNAETNELTDVSSLVFNMDDFLYQMPVAIKEVAKNDILVHNKEYVIVTEIKENGDIEAINPNRGEKVIILPKKNIFGFNYVTKIVNIVGNMFPKIETATEENPFGNIQQMLMFSALMDNNSNSNDSMMKLMLLNSMDGMKLESGTMPFLAAMLSNM